MSESDVQDLVQGLSPSSQDVLQKYLFWSKKKRTLHVKDIEGELYEYKHASLLDESYNKADVADILTGLLSILRVTVEKDQRETTQAFVEVLRQVLEQADKSNVDLQLDLSPLDNPTHMTSINFLEKNVLEGKGSLAPLGSLGSRSKPAAPLAPISSAAPLAPVEVGPSEKEIQLEQEVARLQEKAQKIQQQYTTMMQEKSKLSQQLAAIKDSSDASASSASARALSLEEELAEFKAVLATKDREIAAGQQQLTGKLNECTQFKTLKKLLAQKTQQVKELRAKLNKYEPDVPTSTLEEEEESSSDDDQ
eukprot:GGOE01014203.1.p1 GENE.GGOE01014203.1~~GGOE01014203.1.p1  ORF type:complete len:317 (-),score=84.14 GGOE01014203.1:228-1151(-)